jgi:hypothetical protein
MHLNVVCSHRAWTFWALVDAPSLQRRTFEVIPQLRIQPTTYSGGAFDFSYSRSDGTKTKSNP